MLANEIAGHFSPTGTALAEQQFSSERSEHDRVLSAQVRPDVLKPGCSLLDDVWEVRSAKPDGLGKRWLTLDFTVPIAPGPVALNDQGHVNDLLTAKLYTLHSYSGQLSWTSTTQGMYRSLTTLMDLVRWRLAEGLPLMSDLNSDWFETFTDKVRERGRWALLPHEERICSYLKSIEDGRETFPITFHPTKSRLAVNEVARKLGVSGRLQVPDREWSKILRCFREHHPDLYEETVRTRLTDPLSPIHEGDQGNSLTESQTFEILAPFERLWSLRNVMGHDPLGYRAFDGRTTRARLAKTIASTELERTLVPPPEQVCWLVDSSCRLIVHCNDTLKEAYRAVADAYILYPHRPGVHAGKNELYRNRRMYIQDALASAVETIAAKMANGPVGKTLSGLDPVYERRDSNRGKRKKYSIRDLLFKMLPAACAAVIAALTARRNSEICRLQHGCISYDANGDPNMSVWIAKTLRKEDSIPAPTMVVQAVNVLDWLTETQRSKTGNNWLFSFSDPAKIDQNVRFTMNEGLRMLSSFSGVPSLPDGTEWPWKAHQFRTFFGVTYFWRFDFPSLTALSDFFRHFNPTMTKSYVTRVVKGALLKLQEEKAANRRLKRRNASDEVSAAVSYASERAVDFERCRTDFMLRIAKAAADGTAPLSGRAGELWNRELLALMDQAAAYSHLATPAERAQRTLDELIADWVNGKTLEPHPAGHSFCKCGKSDADLATAACLQARKGIEEDFEPSRTIGPDYSYAADEVCSKCPHNVQRACANRSYWLAAIKESEISAKLAPSESQRKRATERANVLRAHSKRCFDGDDE